MMFRTVLMLMSVALATGCVVKPGTPVTRHNDEIVAAGERFRIGTPVVLWTDPGGYDAYRVEQRFTPWSQAKWNQPHSKIKTPNRYGLRNETVWSDETLEAVRGGWTLEQLQDVVDRFVIHYDVCGTSMRCFDILHDHRGLSVHFMLDVDGTIYQTLDLQERAWHAGTNNDRSVGIEIANIGAYPEAKKNILNKWYSTDTGGRTVMTIPDAEGAAAIRTPGFVGRPSRNEPVVGQIHDRMLYQYDLTPQQYDALIKLTAGLAYVFPKIELDAPRDSEGKVLTGVLPEPMSRDFVGLVGHYHLTTNKVDPGPAFDWERLIRGARNASGR